MFIEILCNLEHNLLLLKVWFFLSNINVPLFNASLKLLYSLFPIGYVFIGRPRHFEDGHYGDVIGCLVESEHNETSPFIDYQTSTSNQKP